MCPFNNTRLVQLTRETSFSHEGTKEHEGTKHGLVPLMEMDGAGWDEFTRGSAIRRPGYAGFKRSVAVALGNWGSELAVPVLRAALRDPEPLVRGHAAWALGRVGSASALAALSEALSTELDRGVVER